MTQLPECSAYIIRVFPGLRWSFLSSLSFIPLYTHDLLLFRLGQSWAFFLYDRLLAIIPHDTRGPRTLSLAVTTWIAWGKFPHVARDSRPLSLGATSGTDLEGATRYKFH